ncbi:hypothetical protein GGR52DRAFT_296932 [Hypoxylon sp. FL1284]|nr:hypothetical protein GGR52DRAFT_296932 [Hypoxylon sp. FL1284]
MALQPELWQMLPLELVERILDMLVEDHEQDPAFQWTTLRHTSGRQMRRIERHFLSYWLPQLTITLYSGPRCQIDYHLSPPSSQENSNSSSLATGRARFQAPDEVPVDDHAASGEDLRALWGRYGFENRVAHLRLGEGVLSHGMTGGYVVNDTDIVGLEVAHDGLAIEFDWRRTLDALLREEVMMRKLQTQMVENRKATLAAERRWPPFPRIQRIALVKQFVLDIQMAKRVATQQHRLRRHDPTGQTLLGSLTPESRHLHKQQPVTPSSSSSSLPPQPVRTCCAVCSRRSGPSIFEVVACEESVVLSLDGWQRLSKEELLDLYAEAYGWGCYRSLGQETNFEWQKSSKNDWLTVCSSGAEKLHSVRRWTPWF